MSDPKDDSLNKEQRVKIAAGVLAAGVVGELVRPLREMREDLAVMVEELDRHVVESRGPRGLSWKEVATMRERLAESYLRSRKTARLASEMAEAVGQGTPVRETTDMNKLVESALNLSRHRIASDTEVFVDLATLPLVRTFHGEIMLVVAEMVTVAASSAAGLDGSALSIRTTRESGTGGSAEDIVIYVMDNGGGAPEAAEWLVVLGRGVASGSGGSFEGTSEAGKGSAFELRIPVQKA